MTQGKLTIFEASPGGIVATMSPSPNFDPAERPSSKTTTVDYAGQKPGNKLADDLYKIDGVHEVSVRGGYVGITLAPGYAWTDDLKKKITKTIKCHLNGKYKATSIEYRAKPKMDEEEIGPNDPWPIDEPEFSPDQPLKVAS